MGALVFRAVVLAVLALAAAPALAQTAGGFYLSSELGINFAPGFDFFGNSTDQGSVCDPFINPDAGSRAAAGCPTMGTGWKSVFDGTLDVLRSHAVPGDYVNHRKVDGVALFDVGANLKYRF